MTSVVGAPSGVGELAYRHVIDDELWRRITARIVQDLEFQRKFGDQPQTVQRGWSDRILNEAIGFLQLCAHNDGQQRYRPSTLVDIGWHMFILYTREYCAFCHRIAGRYIHHAPSDVPGRGDGTDHVHRTLAALRVRGPVDEALWQSGAAQSHDCDG